MPKFSRKGLNSRKPWTSVLEHCNDLFPCKRLDVWFELILSECVRSLIWTVPLFDRTVNWFSIPAKNWLLWLLTWTVISFWLELLFQCGLTHLFDLWWWTYFLAIVWIFGRWIASVFPRTLFEFRSMKWFSDSMFELWLLTWTNISFWSMTWTFIPAVWFMIVDLFPCKWLNQYSREHCLIWLLTWTVIWTITWTVIPERTKELWMLTWTVISAKLLDLNRYSRANVWILIQYSREIIDLNRYSWANVWIMNVDLNRYSWVIVWILIDELNQYSREIVDLYRYSWANDWIFIDDLIQYSREIVDLSERLNFHRFKRVFAFWSIIELIQYSRDIFGLIWLTCTVIPEQTFEFWSSNPVTFVWLNFVTVGSPRMCFRINFVTVFEHSVHMYTYLRSRIWTIYFRNLGFVTWRSRGMWTMRFRSFDFVHVSDLPSGVSDLLSRRNALRPQLRSFSRVRDWLSDTVLRVCVSELTSYVFPNYFRGGIWANCFRSVAFVPFPEFVTDFPTLCFVCVSELTSWWNVLLRS